MSVQTTVQTQTKSKPAITSVAHSLLQRCTATQECDECRKKRDGMLLQRAAVEFSHVSEVPPIVHEVLRSTGQPLDAQTRAFMEPRFGHDFSNVRVHTDKKADESARAVNALAYTVGQDVVFGKGQYMPTSSAGQKLMAHELTHVIQQHNTIGMQFSTWRIAARDSNTEKEAEDLSGLVASGKNVLIFPHSSNTVHLNRFENKSNTGVLESRSRLGSQSIVQNGSRGPSVTQSGGPQLRVNVLGVELTESTRPIDRRIVNATREEIQQDRGIDLIEVDSLEDMIDKLEDKLQNGGCIRELKIWNHARPLTGEQRVGVRMFESHSYPSYFSLRWLLNEANTRNLNRLRGVFCCNAQMHWLGCATAGVVAPEGQRTQSELEPTGISERERKRRRRRFEDFGEVYQSPEDAAQHGANLLAARFGEVNIQSWADATCTQIRAANDFVFFTSGERTHYVGFGGGFNYFPPSSEAQCPCDLETQRVGGEAPEAPEVIRSFDRPCSEEALSIIHEAIPIAQRRVRSSLAGLRELIANWGEFGKPPDTELQRVTSMALARAFNVQFDKTFWIGPLGMDRNSVRTQHANDRGNVSNVLSNFEKIYIDLTRYTNASSCAVGEPSYVSPCFSCKLAQYPTCESSETRRGSAAFVRSDSQAIFLCPTFFRTRSGSSDRSHILIHELSHFYGTVDAITVGNLNVQGFYGCPLRIPGSREDLPTLQELVSTRQNVPPPLTLFDPSDLSRIADSYACFADYFQDDIES